MARLLPVLLLGGCPYVFGPPDLSNVDRDTTSPEPTGATGDTASSGTVPTADTSLPEPGVLEATARPSGEGFNLLLVAPDPQELSWGGTVTVTGSEGEVVLSIPTDLDWDPQGETRLVYPRPDPCVSLDDTLVVEVRDQDGLLRSAAQLPIHVDGRGMLVHEQEDPYDLGAVDHFTVFCGGIDRPSDNNRTLISLPRAGEWRLSVAWTNNADLDLRLHDEGDQFIAMSNSGYANPETLTRELEEAPYILSVFHFGGPFPDRWLVLVEEVVP